MVLFQIEKKGFVILIKILRFMFSKVTYINLENKADYFAKKNLPNHPRKKEENFHLLLTI